jgi:hypothetical protein
MQGAMLRHQQPAPGRKPVPRGASRMVAKEPLSARLPKANFSVFKRLLWPVLLVVAGFGAYEGALRLMPYADRPRAREAIKLGSPLNGSPSPVSKSSGCLSISVPHICHRSHSFAKDNRCSIIAPYFDYRP